MGPLGWGLIQHDWCSYKKRLRHRQTQREDHVKIQGGEDGHLQAEDRGSEETTLLRPDSVCLSCYNKNAINWWIINNKNLFRTVLEAGNSRSGCQHSWVRALFWAADFSWWPRVVEGAGELSGVFYEDTNSTGEGSVLTDLISSQRAPPSEYHHLGA